jgi:CheY-like chemotaxis protein
MKSVLFVEDRHTTRLYFESEVNDELDVNLIVAANLNEALIAIEKQSFDLIITDLNLDPQKDENEGYIVIKKGVEKDTEVWVHSNQYEDEVKLKCKSLGASRFIDKLSMNLFQSLKEHIERG